MNFLFALFLMVISKYWSDLLIRFARHPLTVRLSVTAPAGEALG
jgi:hypothetical protein